MSTKVQAEAVLAALPLERAVAVEDTADAKVARRSYVFFLTTGNRVECITDAAPTAVQLDELAAHLPLAEKDRAAALEAMKASPTIPRTGSTPSRDLESN
jgi:hypothetical protein